MAYRCARCNRVLKGESGIDYIRSSWTWVDARMDTVKGKVRRIAGHWEAKPGARYCHPRDQARCDQLAAKRLKAAA